MDLEKFHRAVARLSCRPPRRSPCARGIQAPQNPNTCFESVAEMTTREWPPTLIRAAGGSPERCGRGGGMPALAKVPKVTGDAGQVYVDRQTAKVLDEAEKDREEGRRQLRAGRADAGPPLRRGALEGEGRLEAGAVSAQGPELGRSHGRAEGPNDGYRIGLRGLMRALKKYARDLTDAAPGRQDRPDHSGATTRFLRRAMQVLSRRTKNNPVLIGEPGAARRRSRKVCDADRGTATCRNACATSG